MEFNTLTVLTGTVYKRINIDKCPGCGSELKFNVHTGKKHCPDCGRIWSFEIDTERMRLIIHEFAYNKSMHLKTHSRKEE